MSRKISNEKTFSVNNEASEILKHIDQYNQVKLFKKTYHEIYIYKMNDCLFVVSWSIGDIKWMNKKK